MTGALSPTHWLLIILVMALLFGAKRLPAAARGLGQSMRIFKAETSALADDQAVEKRPSAVQPTPAQAETPASIRTGESAA